MDGLVEGEVEALRRAANQADFVKGQKSHVLAMGVGAAVTDGNSARRLTAISGFDKWPSSGVSFEEADYTLVENFDALAAALRQIAIALCKASVTVTKLVDETPSDGIDNYQPADGWTFTADVSVPGGYKWVQPNRRPTPARCPATKSDGVPNSQGVATFQWKPTDPTATSTVTMIEQVKPGYIFVDYTCEKSAPGRTTKIVRTFTTPKAVTGNLGPNEFAKCTVRNRRAPPDNATIRIIKDAVPNDAHVFNFTGTGPIGEFQLSDNDKPEPPTYRDFTVPPAPTS